jgi:hypothetical protein
VSGGRPCLKTKTIWAKVFILPKKVVRLIEQKLNRFLWSGRDTKAHAKVAWSQLCVPKQEGGLGIKRIEVWNKASMLNHIWNLFTKAGSLWVAWINTNRLKGRCLWEISIPNSCSWSWKKLLKLRDIAKRFISFKVGNGSRVFLWFDHWPPAWYLLETFGHRIVHDSGFPLRSKLEVAIKNGEWNWPLARSDALVVIQSKLFDVGIGDTDLAVWNAKNGQYTCADAWDKLREVHPAVGWWELVWFPSSIPKHFFFFFVACFPECIGH